MMSPAVADVIDKPAVRHPQNATHSGMIAHVLAGKKEQTAHGRDIIHHSNRRSSSGDRSSCDVSSRSRIIYCVTAVVGTERYAHRNDRPLSRLVSIDSTATTTTIVLVAAAAVV